MPEPENLILNSDSLDRNNKMTIVSMAVIASASATLLHEGLGHGVVAWMRGDIVTELTSNHLSAMRADRVVDAGGTIVNLIAGFAALAASKSVRNNANRRYFLWILAALNLLPGAGYFLYSGIGGFGDWAEFIRGWPHQALLRSIMVLFGAALYILCARLLAVTIAPFVPRPKIYNTVGRLPYYVAGLFSCAAGAFDPLGLKIFLLATVAAAFGGSSGLLWADSLIPRDASQETLFVERQTAWWIAAIILGGCYIYFVGRGLHFAH